jgi:hypothetical protein
MPSPAIEISGEDRLRLESWTRSPTVSAGHVHRARIVLSVAEGAGTSAVARRLGVSRPTVIKWRDRFAAKGIAGLDDEQRSGRPKVVDDAAVIAATSGAAAALSGWALRVAVGSDRTLLAGDHQRPAVTESGM